MAWDLSEDSRHDVLARWPNGPVSTDVLCDPNVM